MADERSCSTAFGGGTGLTANEDLATDPVREAERDRLVRVCTRLTGDAQIAEDLAQEVLLRAHRSGRRHEADQSRRAWLDGIARHVCLDWIRHRRRRPEVPLGVPPPERADALNIDREIERGEIIALLDKALACLPPPTRAALVDHYVRDVPLSEIALRRGWSGGAAAMRLQRGRQALCDLLLTELREDAVELGLVDPVARPTLRPTPLWCDCCGTRRLRARFHPAWCLHLECPDCTRAPAVLLHIEGENPFGDTTVSELFAGVRGVRRALGRVSTAFHTLLGNGLPGVSVRCRLCGQRSPLRVGGPYGDVEILCRHCAVRPGLAGIHAFATHHPAMVRFQRAHPRRRGLPARFLEAGGTRAVLLRYESLTSASRLEFLYAHAPMVLLGVWGGTPAPRAAIPPHACEVAPLDSE